VGTSRTRPKDSIDGMGQDGEKKKKGSLGYRELESFNRALLADYSKLLSLWLQKSFGRNTIRVAYFWSPL
jgi:hypothetical protein